MNPELPLAGLAILIVEDSLTQRLVLQQLLLRHGCKVTAAGNGIEALAELAKARPEIVITDINMPGMNGYELCARIKDTAALKDLPVILLTSLSDPQDILRGLECGADNFIVKPYDEDFLLSRIQFVRANQDLRRLSGGNEATEIFFAGRQYHLTSTRVRSLDLLLSTYETAVQKNLELSRAKEILEQQAGELQEKNSQMRAELEMAREIQAAFLSQPYPVFPPGATPEQSALRFSHRYHATTELGGDFFDIAAVSGTSAGIFICDVMGHGVRAALITAIIRGLVEEFRTVGGDPGAFLTCVNRQLWSVLKQTSNVLFASAYYVVIDLARGELRHAGAGHPPPLLLTAPGTTLERLSFEGVQQGAALGLLENSSYTTCRRKVSPGDRLVLFTDGLYEVGGADGAYYDADRLFEVIERHASLPTGDLFDRLLAEVRSYSATGSFEDDVCLVGVDVLRTPAA